MKRTTFVDGNLFKKKNLFDQDSDEEDKVTLSKPVKKTV